MTKEKMRIKIALCLGAKWYATKGSDLWLSFKDLASKHIWASKWEHEVHDHDSIVICEDVPNWPEDLNACQHLLEFIEAGSIAGSSDPNDHPIWRYGAELEIQTLGKASIGINAAQAGLLSFIHPEFKCEAFLKAMNAWEEDEAE